MAWQCKFGLHKWDGCRCSECGTKRDKQHKWKGYKCTICNVERSRFAVMRQQIEEKYRDMPHEYRDTFTKHAIIIIEILNAFRNGLDNIDKGKVRNVLMSSGAIVSDNQLNELLYPISTDCKESNMQFLIIAPHNLSLKLYHRALSSWQSSTNGRRFLSVFAEFIETPSKGNNSDK